MIKAGAAYNNEIQPYHVLRPFIFSHLHTTDKTFSFNVMFTASYRKGWVYSSHYKYIIIIDKEESNI